jgi:hypothetical protein
MRWHWEPLPRQLGPAYDWRPFVLYRGDELAMVVRLAPDLCRWHAALLDDMCLALSEPVRCDVPLADIEGD